METAPVVGAPVGSRGMRLDRLSLQVHGQTREYLLGLPPGAPRAIVFAFHGAGSNAEGMRRFTQLDEKAERERFAVVFPEGTGRTADRRSWNAGAPHVYAAKHAVDEPQFFKSMLAALQARLSRHPAHVFLTGMSNGGLLCYALANQLGSLIHGIAPVACATLDLKITCPLPMPVLHIHGTEDAYVPYQGGEGGQTARGTVFESAERIVAAWAAHNGCSFPPQHETLPPNVADGTCVQRTSFVGSSTGADVTLYVVVGGGHTWPGYPTDYHFLGPVTENLDANEVIWDFFATQLDRRTPM